MLMIGVDDDDAVDVKIVVQPETPKIPLPSLVNDYYDGSEPRIGRISET